MSSSSSSSISPVSAPPWEELPLELTTEILSKLGLVEKLTAAQLVCKTWQRVCRHPAMWRRIDLRRHTSDKETYLDVIEMCCHAVDLSQGQLTELSIHVFCYDYLLFYIAPRSSQLRRLEIVDTFDVTGCALSEAVKFWASLEELHLDNTPVEDEVFENIGRCCPLFTSFKLNSRWSGAGGFLSSSCGLSRAVKCLPLLEELHLYNTHISKEDIENIGRSCLLLTSFKLNIPWECDEDAIAIAGNMPRLCHLQLIGSGISNEGLEAILDGCPCLESLDLRKCWDVCISGDLERSLFKRGIKDLRLPNDPLDDFPLADDLDYYED